MKRIRKLCAIMFTDIEGYTALMQRDEAKGLETRGKHREVFERETSAFHGKIIQYFGDGTLSIFDSAVEAVNCSIELQKAFLKAPQVPVRIGIHMGEVIISENDIVGDSVNIASRIESLAIPGSVLISGKVKKEIKNQQSIVTIPLGTFSFKNDENDREVFAIAHPSLVTPSRDQVNTSAKLKKKKDKSIFFSFFYNNKKNLIRLIFPILALLLIGAIWIGTKNNNANKTYKENLLFQIDSLSEELYFVSGQSGEGINAWKAYQLALKYQEDFPKDPDLEKLWLKFSQPVTIITEPSGADVYIKAYQEEEWYYWGKTPIDSTILSYGFINIKFEKDTYSTAEDVIWNTVFYDKTHTYKLVPTNELHDGMVLVQPPIHPHAFSSINLPALEHYSGEFFMDKFEVSNKQFQEFADQGGYARKEFWTFPFVEDGQNIPWEEAMDRFSDQTGLPGPVTWIGGRFQDGEEDLPVTGISWYEAAAYAQFMGKQLPSIYHWRQAYGIYFSSVFLPESNLLNNKPWPVSHGKSLGRFGVLNFTGNAREWLYNKWGNNSYRLMVGGGWNDPIWAFHRTDGINPFNREITNGFRCILDRNDNSNAFKIQIPDKRQYKDYYNLKPVNEETFDILLRQFEYNQDNLNAEIVTNTEEEYWIKEEIEMNTAYDNGSLTAFLFIPKNSTPPYQTVVYWPGSNALNEDNLQIRVIDFLMKNGRAVLYPIYLGTYTRKVPKENDTQQNNQYTQRDMRIKQVKDLKKSLDYLITRNDIDTSKLAYAGNSWGGGLGPLVLAVEKRFKAAVLVTAGLHDHLLSETDPINYIGHVKVPVLILNGKYDQFNPYEQTQKPFLDLLGTPDQHKKLVTYESNHHIPKTEMIKETLGWLNKYLGPVEPLKK